MASGRHRPQFQTPLTSLEICAGAGGQAVGLHRAGFDHLSLVEWDRHAVDTLKANVGSWPGWSREKVEELEPGDVRDFLTSQAFSKLAIGDGELDLLAGGVPCPPFSLAGKRLGSDDERDLFPAMLEIVERMSPKAIMIENVRGILEPPHVFIEYRRKIVNKLHELGYEVPRVNGYWSVEKQDAEISQVWRRVNARDFRVPQLRPRAILVAIRCDVADNSRFSWPVRERDEHTNVLSELESTMRKRCRKYWNLNQDGQPASEGERTGKDVFYGWKKNVLDAIKAGASGVAPTLVGGSRKHGGADLGPSRAKKAWAALGVDGNGLANDIEYCDPKRDLFRPDGPMLTVEQAAIIQGFPLDWDFQGGKTARYRQVGNAFPPPVAEAIGRAIAAVLRPDQRSGLLEGYVMEGEDYSSSRNGAGLAIFDEDDLSGLCSPGGN
jgi:DNA (cytosine-5)-methyltransferase 1